MVGPYRRARTNATAAADAILALMGIDDPTERQHVGAHLIGEFVIKVINFLPAPEPKE